MIVAPASRSRVSGPTRRLRSAIRAAFGRDGVAWATPQVAAIGGFLVAYGVGLVGWAWRDTQRPLLITVAVGIGLVGWLAGIALGWRPEPVPDEPGHRGPVARWVAPVGVALVLAGWLALILYFVRIGTLPILLTDVENARVDAATRGGAILRVLSFLALLGTWLFAADAGARRELRRTVVASAFALVTSVAFVLTANRAQAVQVLAVAAVAWCLAAGLRRARIRLFTVGATVVVVLVLGAGLIGAWRFAHSPGTWDDPEVRAAAVANDWPALTSIAVGNYLRVPVRNFDLTMQAVPDVIPFQLGRTYLQPLLTVLPGRQTTFDADLKVALNEDYAGGGTVPSILGEAWANFGPFGWLLVPLVAGAALAALYGIACRVAGPATWALYAWLLVHLVGANLSGILVASPFPYMAVVILGGAAAWEARHRDIGARAPEPAA